MSVARCTVYNEYKKRVQLIFKVSVQIIKLTRELFSMRTTSKSQKERSKY